MGSKNHTEGKSTEFESLGNKFLKKKTNDSSPTNWENVTCKNFGVKNKTGSREHQAMKFSAHDVFEQMS
jgi:hypothetical protein